MPGRRASHSAEAVAPSRQYAPSVRSKPWKAHPRSPIMRRLYVDREDDTAPAKRPTTASTSKRDLHFTARLDDGL